MGDLAPMAESIQMRVAVKPYTVAQTPGELIVDEQLLNSCDWDKPDEMFKDTLS